MIIVTDEDIGTLALLEWKNMESWIGLTDTDCLSSIGRATIQKWQSNNHGGRRVGSLMALGDAAARYHGGVICS